MTPIELRQKLHHQLDQLSSEELPLVDDFLASMALLPATGGAPMPAARGPIGAPESTPFTDFLAHLKQQPLRRADPIRAQAKGKDLLPMVGTWQGDDLEASLQILQETRSQSQF